MRIPKGGIAFFDSGIGGLTVLNECRKLLQDEVFYYYGDNRRAPYGNLPPEKILRYTKRAFKRFRRLKVKAAVIACNTATAVCVENLRKRYSFPIVGAEPAVCLAAAKGGEVFVLTTRATFESERFRALCKKAAERFPASAIRPMPCDGLAGEIEARISEKGADFTFLLPRGKPTAVVLGCTHYVYIAKQIEAFYGCSVYDGNRGIAERVNALLNERKKEDRDERPPNPFFSFLKPPSTTKASVLDHKTSVVHEKNTNKKPNKRSSAFFEKHRKTPKKVEKKGIFFLGSGKKRNKSIHKQMFG